MKFNLLEKLDNFILKHHSCIKNMKFYSISYHTDEFGIKTLRDIEYRCAICNKSSKEI